MPRSAYHSQYLLLRWRYFRTRPPSQWKEPQTHLLNALVVHCHDEFIELCATDCNESPHTAKHFEKERTQELTSRPAQTGWLPPWSSCSADTFPITRPFAKVFSCASLLQRIWRENQAHTTHRFRASSRRKVAGPLPIGKTFQHKRRKGGGRGGKPLRKDEVTWQNEQTTQQSFLIALKSVVPYLRYLADVIADIQGAWLSSSNIVHC